MADPTSGVQALVAREARDTPQSYTRLLEYASLNPEERMPTALAKRWGITYQSVFDTLKKYKFKERVKPWDAHMATTVTTAMVESVHEHTRELVAEHVRIWADVRGIGRKALDRLLENDGEDLSPTQALAFLEAAFKAERLLQGAATEHVAVVARGLDTSALDIDEMRELKRLLNKAGAGG